MADFKVRFVGDIGNLRSFDQSIRNTVLSARSALQQSNVSVIQSVAGGPLTGSSQAEGLLVRNAQTTVDSINRTFQQSGDIVRRYIKDYSASINAIGDVTIKPIFGDAYVSSFKKNIGSLDEYQGLQRQQIELEGQLAAVQQTRAVKQAVLLQQEIALEKQLKEAGLAAANATKDEGYLQTDTQRQAKLDEADSLRARQVQALAAKDSEIAALRSSYTIDNNGNYRVAAGQKIQSSATGTVYPGGAFAPKSEIDAKNAALQAERVAITQNYTAEIAAQEKGAAELEAGMRAEVAAKKAIYTQLEADLAKNGADMVALQLAADAKMESLIKNSSVYASTQRTPPIPPQLESLLRTSPDFLQRAQAQGFAVRGTTLPEGSTGLKNYAPGQAIPLSDSQAFAEIVAQQNANVTGISRDATKGKTNVGIQFDQLNENAKFSAQGTQQFKAEIDDTGSVIQKLNGPLSGINNTFTNLGRTLYRTAQFAVSAGLTFGTFGVIINQLSSINNLNANLTRLGTTTGFSAAQVKGLFTDLANVAFQTATPLADVVNAADDIALAVKRAGQSTQEYQTDIVSLTQSVGILTNLTGIDTVKATDLLTSAFKQLEIAPSDLLGILDKVTAVAGGQSSAISDIIQGIGGIASAAKDGNLSIDQMIGTLQTLSQVTAKSPAEVATSFKNLIGSLASPGSIKELKTFGINLKDATTGEVRNIIDVYSEIADKIKSGVIPSGDIQAVVRAISGGPRRAPDAAALLDNIGKVNSATATSINATNEALIANARILDTNSAKVTQFKVAFDAAIFDKFGGVVSDLVSKLAELGLGLINVIKTLSDIANLPFVQPFVTAALAIGGTIIALRLLTSLGSGISRALGAISLGFGQVAVSADEATGQLALFDAASAGGKGATTGGFGATLGKLSGKAGVAGLAGGLVGAGISASTGGDLIDNLLAAGTTGGATLALVGVPEVGIPLAIGSQIISSLKGITSAKKEDTTVTAANDQATLTSIQTYKQAQTTIQDLTDKHRLLAKQIEGLTSSHNLDAAALTNLHDLQIQYADNTIDMADANKALNDSVSTLGDSLGRYQKDLVASGQIDPSTLKQVTNDLTSRILKATDPDFQPGGKFANADLTNVSLESPKIQSVQTPPAGFIGPPAPGVTFAVPTGPFTTKVQSYGNTTGVIVDPQTGRLRQLRPGETPPAPGQGFQDTHPKLLENNALAIQNAPFSASADQFAVQRSFLTTGGSLIGKNADGTVADLSKIASGTENVKELFDSTGTKITSVFNLSLVSLDAVQAGLDKLKASGDPLADTLQATFNKSRDAVDAFSAILDKVQLNLANIQAQQQLGLISPDNAKSLTNQQNLLAQAAYVAQYNIPLPKIPVSAQFPANGPGQIAAGEEARRQQQTAQNSLYGKALAVIANPGDVKTAKDYADTVLKIRGEYNDLASKGAPALTEAENRVLLGVITLTDRTQKYSEAVKALAALQKQLQTSLNASTSSFAAREASLAQQLAQGDFSGKGGAAKYAALEAESEKAYEGQRKVTRAVNEFETDAAKTGGALAAAKALRLVEQGFTKIPGLQDAATLSAQDFITKLYDQGIQLGLTGTQMDTLTNKILLFIATLSAIPNSIQVAIDVVTSFGTQTGQPGLTPGGARSQGGLAGDVANSALNNPSGDFGSQAQSDSIAKQFADARNKFLNDPTIKALLGGSAPGSLVKKPASGSTNQGPVPGLLDLSPDILQSEQLNLSKQPADISTIIANAKKLQGQIPGQTKRDKDAIVEILDGTKKVAEVRGISEELLRKSMDELSAIEKKRLDFDTKADTIRRIRIGSGDFAAIANVPFNSTNNVSVGGPQGPITVNLNVNGQILTPAQLSSLSDQVGARLKAAIIGSGG